VQDFDSVGAIVAAGLHEGVCALIRIYFLIVERGADREVINVWYLRL
jgi:hypothetical protein